MLILPLYLINRLQKIQIIAARIISRTRKFDHITPVMQTLHWLPKQYRFMFEILLIFISINGIAPSHTSICDLIQLRKLKTSLRLNSID